MVKFQELKALKDQIASTEKESTTETKKIDEKLSTFENLFSSLEKKIDTLDADNEESFEAQKREIEENFEELQKEISNIEKKGKQVL
jgi:chromosome segregation ATPase